MKDRFVDILLLSIIGAYEHHRDKPDQQRLSAARDALFGQKFRRGRLSLDDEMPIFEIEAELQKPKTDLLKEALTEINPDHLSLEKQAEIAREPLSARAASRKVVNDAPIDPNSKAYRLRRKAREANFTKKDLTELESTKNNNSHEMKSIRIILEELQNLRVKSNRS